jgi:hypothetical protein
MRGALCVFALLAYSALGAKLTVERAQFEEWKAMHSKTYKSAAHENRYFAAWSTNLKLVTKHNKEADRGEHTFWLAMNHIADLSAEEYRHMMLAKGRRGRAGTDQTSRAGAVGTFEPDFSETPPNMVDWRTTGVVGPVKNQGISPDVCSAHVCMYPSLSTRTHATTHAPPLLIP